MTGDTKRIMVHTAYKQTAIAYDTYLQGGRRKCWKPPNYPMVPGPIAGVEL